MSDYDLPHVVCTGNAFDGLALWGPFSDFDEAQEYAEKYVYGHQDYTVVPVNVADKPVSIQRIS